MNFAIFMLSFESFSIHDKGCSLIGLPTNDNNFKPPQFDATDGFHQEVIKLFLQLLCSRSACNGDAQMNRL